MLMGEYSSNSRSPEYRGFEQGPIRPPSEAHSLLIRVGRNCPWNRCRFCGVYKGTRFSRRPLEHVLWDIDAVAACVDALRAEALPLSAAAVAVADQAALGAAWNWYHNGMRSVFLQDGDPLLIPPSQLVAILRRLREHFPDIERITTYARSKSVARLAVTELEQMRIAGLDRIHVGFETGSDEILTLMNKGASKALHVEAGRKAKQAGMELSAYYMPGLGGRERWRENALETADLMNQVDPDYIRLRTLAVPDGLPLAEDIRQGAFTKAGDIDNAREILLFLENLQGISSTVVSDHISNISQEIEGRLPEDRECMLDEMRTLLSWDPEDQLLYRIGRRRGVFAGVSGLQDDAGRAYASRLCRRLGVTVDNVDEITNELVKRFV